MFSPSPSSLARRAIPRRLPAIITLAGFLMLALAVTGREAAADPLFATRWNAFEVGNAPAFIASGDLNGDAKLDLIVANWMAHSVSVLLGRGDGTFAPRVDYLTGSTPVSVAIEDLNGDGKPDLAVANYDSAMTVSVLLGRGDGTFQTKVDYATGSGPDWVVSADFNADGNPDLAVANDGGAPSFPGTVSVLLGRGDGTFDPKLDYPTGPSPNSVAVGDLNGDGTPDLVTANYGDYSTPGHTVSVLLGNGNGTFSGHMDFETGGSNPYTVLVGDLNGDGSPDLMVGNTYSGTVSVLLGSGDGSFAANGNWGVGGKALAARVGDLDGDGRLDMAVPSSGVVSVLLGHGDGTFGPKTDFAAGVSPVSLTIGDFNGDARPDLAVASYGPGTGLVLVNTGGNPWVGVPATNAVVGGLSVRAVPNPVTDRTTISCTLPARADVGVCVYDISGRLVSTLASGALTAGVHEARWNMKGDAGRNVPMGIYLVELRAGAQRATTRVAVLH